MSDFKNYRKKNLQSMRPYIPGEDMSGISVSPEDNVSIGGMIAINPANEDDKWYVAKDFFDSNYHMENAQAMGIGYSVKVMNEGKKVQRAGWNGKNMFLFSIGCSCWEFLSDVSGIDGLETQQFICMKTADNKLIPWLASQADLLANDYQIID
jgi:hypothetical protein